MENRRWVRPRRAWTVLAVGIIALLSPLTAYGKTVAVFDDPAYVDTAGGPFAEADNVIAGLTAAGHTVKTFTGTSGPSFSAGLAGADILVVPELENGNLAAALDENALHTLRSYVATGGGLITFGHNGGNTTTFLNTVFGWGLSSAGTFGPYSKTSAASGTAFGGGPASLPDNDATDPLNTASLPASAAVLYSNGSASAVTAFTVGSGEVVQLAWDWFNAAPVGTENGGWLNVLQRAVTEASGAGCTITGTPGADTLTGTGGRDRICAMRGSDLVNAGGGNDVVIAGRGNDLVNGGGGNDRLDLRDGVRGNDQANGGPGTDTCPRDRGDSVISC